jgi:transposase InsO family protein
LLAQLAGAAVFSKIDCNSGFYQIKLAEKSMLLTCFTMPFGRFVYQRLPQGLSSSSEVYQARMHEILDGADGALCLVDDVLIYGVDQAQHDARLRTVLDRLCHANVTLNDKCECSRSKLKWAGYIISGSGVQADPDRVKAIVDMQPPTNVTEVRCFLGMLNQFAKFTADLAERSAPIRDLLHKDRAWVWDAVHQKSFDAVKQAIITAPVLALYDAAKPTIVSADSSSYGLGSVLLQQQPDKSWRPVTYASRSLTEVERRYAQIEKECLALTWACERLADYLVGIRFTLQTDHKPLITLLSSRRALDDVPPRIQRMRIRLMRFDYLVQYTPGAQLGAADTLSRFPLQHQPPLVDQSDVVEQYVSTVIDALPVTDVMLRKAIDATTTDDVLQQVAAFCSTTWPVTADALSTDVRPFWHSRENITVQNGLLLYGSRIIVPSSLRHETMIALHAGHLGVAKCRSKARQSVWWPKIGADIDKYVNSCQTCQHYARDRAEPLLSTSLPALPWQKVATDLFELNGLNYIVVVDYYSRYIEYARLPSATSAAVILALQSIFARHGIPMLCVSDGGPCYSSSEFETFAGNYGFEHQRSSPRFSQANGAAERAVQTVKSILRKADDPFLAMLSYRTTPVLDGYSPAQLLMGRQPRSTVPTTPDVLQPRTPDANAVRLHDQSIKTSQAANYNRRHSAKNGRVWAVGDRVWVKDANTEAAVTKVLPFRSYQLRTTAGTFIRRNGRALRVPLPPKAQSSTPPMTSPTEASTPSTTTRYRLREQQLQPKTSLIRQQPSSDQRRSRLLTPTVVTRSGRQSRQPQRMNL